MAPLLIAIMYLKNIFPKLSKEIKKTLNVNKNYYYHRLV